MQNSTLSKPPEGLTALIQETFRSHEAKILCDLSKDVEDTSALKKLFTFVKNEIPDIESISILSKDQVEYFMDRIALYLKIDLGYLKTSSDKDTSYQIAEKIIREYLYDILSATWEDEPQMAQQGVVTIKKAIDKISFVQNIEKEKLLAITGILDIEKTILSSEKEVSTPSKLYFTFEEKYRHILNELAKQLKEDYQCICSRTEFVNVLHNPDKKQFILCCKSEEKLKDLIGVILILKEWKILRIKGGNGFWKYLAIVLMDDRKNLISKDLNKYASNLRDNELLIKDLKFFLSKLGIRDNG